jgi:hypothetical protein
VNPSIKNVVVSPETSDIAHGIAKDAAKDAGKDAGKDLAKTLGEHAIRYPNLKLLPLPIRVRSALSVSEFNLILF